VYYEQGLFSPERYEFLANRDFTQYDVILHEAGIPPIHTSAQVLSLLPEKARKNLYLVHTAERDLKKELGLRCMQVGIQNTLVLIGGQCEHEDTMIGNLQFLCGIDLINWVPL
jgi:hypothetical protein